MEIQIVEDEELRYVANVEEGNVNLRYSKSEIWTSHTRGTHIGELKDTGNNIKINVNGKKIKLNYAEFIEVLTMMNIKHNHDEKEYRERGIK